MEGEDGAKIEEAKKKYEEEKKFNNLFKGLKFFLTRYFYKLHN